MKLIVIRDIFDQPNINKCISTLLPYVENIQFISLNELSGCPDLQGDPVHEHLFKHNGIDAVVQALQTYSDPDTIALGYSAGGTALWRAVQAGMSLKGLFCISSTRLRELGSIAPYSHTYFGSEDAHRPHDIWLKKTPSRYSIFKGVNHNFYDGSFDQMVYEYRQTIADDIAQFHAQRP